MIGQLVVHEGGKQSGASLVLTRTARCSDDNVRFSGKFLHKGTCLAHPWGSSDAENWGSPQTSAVPFCSGTGHMPDQAVSNNTTPDAEMPSRRPLRIKLQRKRNLLA